MSFHLLRPLHFLVILSFLLTSQSNLGVKANAHTTRDRLHKHGFNHIDATFVVNLETRSDRLEAINTVLGSLGISNHKIVKGVPHRCGTLGCSLSHAMALSECIDSNATTCAIFEDDFELLREPEEANAAIEKFFRNEPPNWQMLMLSSNVLSKSPSEYSHLDVIDAALAGSGYIVHKNFADVLLHKILQAAYSLNHSNCVTIEYAPDVLWRELQRSGKWFALKPLIGKQRASFSDIEQKHVDYRVKF